MILNLIMVLLTIGSIPCLAVGALEEPVLLIGVLVMFLWIEILSRDCFSE